VSTKEEEHRKKQEERITEYIFKREKELREKERVHNERMAKLTDSMMDSITMQKKEKLDKLQLEKTQDLEQADFWKKKGKVEAEKESN